MLAGHRCALRYLYFLLWAFGRHVRGLRSYFSTNVSNVWVGVLLIECPFLRRVGKNAHIQRDRQYPVLARYRWFCQRGGQYHRPMVYREVIADAKGVGGGGARPLPVQYFQHLTGCNSEDNSDQGRHLGRSGSSRKLRPRRPNVLGKSKRVLVICHVLRWFHLFH